MQTLRRWALNRADLVLGVVIAIGVTIGASLLVNSDSARALIFKDAALQKEIVGAIFAGWIAILLASIGAAVRVTLMRQTLISLFSSEITAIQYGLATMEMFEFWAAAHDNPERGALGFADAPRNEDYFQTFHSVSGNIGNLHPRVVESIVRFYTYLKMSRDAAAGLHSWEKQEDPKLRKMNVEYVIRLLGLSMVWGFVALWFMGFKAGPQEQGILQKIQTGYDKVMGDAEFRKMMESHMRKEAIFMFFALAE
ncbi:MAG TPA: hypothetical protein VLX44_22610 [Xanthobacteraceae bacterium]|nr:hypothetical protein [Xanthobacteraceae bacterium]